ncbi:MAG: hypothetical protein ACFFFK_03195 [Candidatus Thorarchaeota archaeon]
MKEIDIELPRKEYLPGEIVRGKVVLKSDLNFTCKKLSIQMFGQMIHTYIELRSKGKRGTTAERKEIRWDLIDRTFDLIENKERYIGRTVTPFRIQLPENLRPSYETSTLGIVYALHASLEVTKEEVLYSTTKITIVHPIADIPDEPVEVSAPEGFTENLSVKMSSQRLCIGESILFSYCINTNTKFKVLRAELVHNERFTGSKETKTLINHSSIKSRTLMKREIPSEELTRHEWKMMSLYSEAKTPPSVSNDELQSNLELHVTLVRRLNLDYSVKIPVIAGHCLKPGWKGERETEFDEMFPEPTQDVPPTSEPDESEVEVILTDEQRVSRNWYNKAVRFKEMGEIDQAIKAVEKAIEWDPDFEDALELRDTF